MTGVMYDSVTVDEIPHDAPAVAGYVGGRWPTFHLLEQLFPHAHRLSIAVRAFEDADCLDVEQGDATPSQVVAWVKRQAGRGVKRPVVYSSVSVMPTILFLLARAHIPRTAVRVWTAHYTGREHLCGPDCGFGLHTVSDATQWTDRALERNLDQSALADTFFTTPAAGPYERFVHGRFPSHWGELDERQVVENYDKARAHPVRQRHQLDMLRAQATFLSERVLSELLDDAARHGDRYARVYRYRQLRARAEGKEVKP